ncbi:hypothetical protein ACFWSF_14800 [Streptomyces sp. NPDC058611]
MTVHPFIAAEKRDGHHVKRACELLIPLLTSIFRDGSSDFPAARFGLSGG